MRVESASRVARPPKAAFTLLELLVVMGIMVVLATIFISNYFGMTRAASYSAAETDVYNMLQLARQRACMDGSKVFFMLIDSNSYVLVHGVGTITKNMNSTTLNGRHRIYDAYADITTNALDKSQMRVWNMDENTYGDDVTIELVNANEALYPGSTEKCSRQIMTINAKLPKAADYNKWKEGDSYGFELYPRQTLPKGFYFGVNSLNTKPNNDKIVFAGDGSSSVVNADGSESKSGTTTIYIYEEIVKEQKREIKIEVVHPFGTIKPGSAHLGGQG